MRFNELDIPQKKILCEHLISNFDFTKTFNIMLGSSWKGYNPIDTDDLHRIVDEISESIIYEGHSSCGIDGFRIGISDNVLYLIFDSFFSTMTTIKQYGIKLCDVYYYFDYNMFLRSLKINKIKKCM